MEQSTADALRSRPAQERKHPARPLRRERRRALRRRLRILALRLVLLVGAFLLVGSSAYSVGDTLRLHMRSATADWNFDLLAWEVRALAQKAGNLWSRPAAGLSAYEGAQAVQAYLARGEELRKTEREINRILSENNSGSTDESRSLAARAAALRAQQDATRPTAQAVLEGQITWTLQAEGFDGLPGGATAVLPPVLFTFTESPRKLVVSPRNRIATAASRMLDPGMPLETMEAAEDAIDAATGQSAYVAATGGMGAFPTMVVDNASLPWILSTVAHEWAHTYLSFFPLGFNYGISPDNTTINETVAEIVGDEIGAEALRLYYPEPARPQPQPPISEEPPPKEESDTFNYFAEMRRTRQAVDSLLRAGRVANAERYMEARRQLFVANGYPIRKLNQGYFAFHGSYGTDAAADVSSPDALGPKVERLRALTPDLRTFLHTVRSITDAAGLDRVLALWEK